MTEVQPPNTVELSDDRKYMTIRSYDGKRTAHLRAARREGFTDDHAFAALDFTFSAEPGSSHVAWRRRIVGSRYLIVGIETGPPIWWWPRVKLGRIVTVGWLRTALRVCIMREGAA
jgi:hypothetical protein